MTDEPTTGDATAEQPLPLVKRVTAQTEEQTLITLGLCITQLRIDGFDPSEIVVLSHLDEGSLAERTKEVVPEIAEFLVPFDEAEPGAGVIRYTSIQAVKGQQFPAVLVTDVYDPDKQMRGVGGVGAADLQAAGEAMAAKSLVTITFDPNAQPTE